MLQLTRTIAYMGTTAAIGAAVAFGTACGPASDRSQQTNLRGSVRIDGSSTVAPITMAIAEDFREVAPHVRVTVGVSGTGGGFKRFANGEIDVSNASRPIKRDELEATEQRGVEFIELPIAFDGLSIVVNRSNTWVDDLTVDEIRHIFRADNPARTWSDIRTDWPSAQIKIFSPGTDSGTFDYFREVTVGKGAIRSDMSVSEDDNVLVTGVAGDRNAIGFFGLAYYEENRERLKVVKVDAGSGPIEPTPQTVEDGTYAPFSRPLFIYLNKRSLDRPEVEAFVDFYLSNASQLAREVGYIRLPQSVIDKARANVASGRTGTQFMNEHGEPVTGPVTQVYK